MAPPKQQQQPQNFKLQLLTLISKLADRDTHQSAASSLASLATQALSSNTLPTFVSCLTTITLADKPLVRKHSLILLTTLVENSRNSAAPYFPKIVSFLTRLLPDPISRSESVSLSRAVTTCSTKHGVLFTVFKPVLECLFTAQEPNTQIVYTCVLPDLVSVAVLMSRAKGSVMECLFTAQENTQVTAAMCLGAVVENSVTGEEVERLGKLVGKLERLVRSDGYKGKAAVLGLIGSVVCVGGVGGRGVAGGLRGVVGCLVECLKSEDWGVRKGAADALGNVAVKERDSVSEFKGDCVRVLESRRFDKVKEVREIMNRTLEAWKQVPDLSDESSPPPRSQCSSREDSSDVHYPPSGRAISGIPQMRKRSIVAAKSAQVGASARKRSPLKGSGKNAGPTTYGKMEEKKTCSRNIAVSRALSMGFCKDDDLMDGDENLPDMRHVVRAPISKTSLGKAHKVGSFNSGSRVVPCGEESLESPCVASNSSEGLHKSHRDSEELSSIRKQLVHIEEQQSGLMDLLQKFMGSTQNGMHSLEARVHGLELTLDKISYDLAVTSGRMTNTDTMNTRCCLLPSADFLTPKFWRRSYATSRYSTSAGTPSVLATQYRAQKNVNVDSSRLQNRRFWPTGGAGFMINPLADMQSETRGVSQVGNC